MGRTFVIAEAGSSHDNDLSKAHRLIDAAKECGADACKFQFWSNSKALAARRNIPLAEPMYAKYKLPQGWLPILAEHCERIGIEFMCSTFLIEDIHVVAPYVSRFKISAFEGAWCEFVRAHHGYGKPVIRSYSEATKGVRDAEGLEWIWRYGEWEKFQTLWCVSEYPTPLDHLKLRHIRGYLFSGLSDHTGNPSTGMLAVAAGARILEAHIRLHDTEEKNPDYPHSLQCEGQPVPMFKAYVDNVRFVEQML